MKKKKVIFDVDTGIDDALAIAYAIKSRRLDILGMTTCFGNVTVEDATRNTAYVVQLLGEDLPVYQGSSEPLNGGELYLEVAQQIHGMDGLGNCLPNVDERRDSPQVDAIRFIIDSIQKYPDDVTLIFVGPLTNLAKVVEQAPEVIPLVKEVVIMGGAVTVPGNVRPHAEANIYADPDAAKIVLQSGLPITLVGLDVTMETLLPREYVTEWEKSGSAVSQFFANITDYYISAYKNFKPGIRGCSLHDPLAVGVVLDPTFVDTKTMTINVDIEGEEIGKTYEGEKAANYTINVCLAVDDERFLKHFLTTLAFEQ